MRTTIQIQNLKCGGCEATIIKKLSAENSIKNVVVDVENSKVSFDYDNQGAIVKVTDMLTELGYPIVGEQNSFARKAKSYMSCAVGRIEKFR